MDGLPQLPRIGTVAWAIPASSRPDFPAAGSVLERYAARFAAVEINSSFYRPHRPATYRRWAASVPEDFRFAVKLPKAITHDSRLVDCDDLLDRFLGEAGELGPKLGPLLVQMAPSLAFDAAVAGRFFAGLRDRFAGEIACEPRHPSWFAGPAEALLGAYRVARVAADPAPVSAAAVPGGWDGFVYRRLHGAPRIYYSDYPAAAREQVATMLAAAAAPVWCIFDNTALGHATANALDVIRRLAERE